MKTLPAYIACNEDEQTALNWDPIRAGAHATVWRRKLPRDVGRYVDRIVSDVSDEGEPTIFRLNKLYVKLEIEYRHRSNTPSIISMRMGEDNEFMGKKDRRIWFRDIFPDDDAAPFIADLKGCIQRNGSRLSLGGQVVYGLNFITKAEPEEPKGFHRDFSSVLGFNYSDLTTQLISPEAAVKTPWLDLIIPPDATEVLSLERGDVCFMNPTQPHRSPPSRAFPD